MFVGLGLKKQNKEDAGNAPEFVCRVIDAHLGASPDPRRSPLLVELHFEPLDALGDRHLSETFGILVIDGEIEV